MSKLYSRIAICSLFCISLLASLPSLGQDCPAPYVEKNGFIVIEAEAASNKPSAWDRRTSINGYTGSAYLRYIGSDNFNTPGRNVYSFKFYVASAGTFRFQWRNRIARGNNSTEHNDSWLRFPDADNFYGQRGSSRIFPRGTGKSPNPEGASGDGWFKVYVNNSGLGSWSYRTVTSDFDPHDIFVRFNSAGVYTVQVAGRSNGHAIDRLVLYRTSKSTSEATNPSLSPTRCSGTSQNQSPTVQAGSNRTVNLPDNDLTLTANASDVDGTISSYSWSKVSGPSVSLSGTRSKSLQLTNLVAGTYEFRVSVTDNDGARASDNVKVFVVKESEPEPPTTTSVTLTLYNANTDQPISGYDPMRNGDVIDLSKTGKSLTVIANTTGDAETVTFNYNGKDNFRIEGVDPFSLGGDIGVDYQPWDYELGNNTLEAIVSGSGGGTTAQTTVNFSIVDGTVDPEPPVSDGVTFTLINTSTNNPVAGFNPILNGAVVDLSKVGNKLSIVANTSDEADKVIFSYNGDSNYKVENLVPYAIAGDSDQGTNITLWDYDLGANEVSAVVSGSNGNTIASNSVSFEIVRDAVDPEPPSVPSGVVFTLYNAVTDRPISGFDPLEDGQTIDLSQTGKSLSIVVNASSEADLVRFNYNGRTNYRVEGEAPFAIAGDIGIDLIPWTPALGSNRLTAIVEDNNGNVIAERTINFNVVDGSNARFSGGTKNNNSVNNFGEESSDIFKLRPYPNPAQDFVIIDTNEDVEVKFYNNAGLLIKTKSLSEGSSKVSITDLNSGMYSIQLQSESKVKTFKLLKQ